jgi:hypothetical protein
MMYSAFIVFGSYRSLSAYKLRVVIHARRINASPAESMQFVDVAGAMLPMRHRDPGQCDKAVEYIRAQHAADPLAIIQPLN